MTPPKNQKQVRSFIGLVKYCGEICAKRSHLLQPLTAPTSKKVQFKWTVVEQKAFDKIKWIVVRDRLFIYADFHKCFDIHTDAIEFQLGSVISEDGKPIAFYRLKLTGPQTCYTVTQK